MQQEGKEDREQEKPDGPVTTDDGTDAVATKPQRFQMFKLTVVNSYGTQDIKELPSDGSLLRLTSELINTLT